MALGPCETTGAVATHDCTRPQLSSTMSFAPYVVTGPEQRTRSTTAPEMTNTPPLIRSGVPAGMPPSVWISLVRNAVTWTVPPLAAPSPSACPPTKTPLPRTG
jgi:hypothetical protein